MSRPSRLPVRRRRLGGVGALVCCVTMLAGCAAMPDSGQVTKVPEESRAGSDPQVRVFGVKPQPNEAPLEIVRGFLEATTSDEAGYQTAKDYLTPQAARNWNPSAGITVLAGGPQLSEVNEQSRDDIGATVTLGARQVATVDADHSYAPTSATYRTAYHLSRINGQWRIDGLPSGLVLSESDYQRIYQSVNRYYFARVGPAAGGSPLVRDVLVADPMYIRRRVDPVTATVQALLAGPGDWLGSVVSSAFPAKTQLRSQGLSLDDSGRLRVKLGGPAEKVGSDQCKRMAAQLLNTVQDQSTARVREADIQRADGSVLCSLAQGDAAAQEYSPLRLVGNGAESYFIDTDHRLVSVANSAETAHRVAGPFGSGRLRLRSVAVSRDEQMAAGVGSDGKVLYVAPLSGGSSDGVRAVVTSAVRKPASDGSDGLSAPSWDGLGDLWVADRSADGASRLLMWRDGRTTQASVENLGDGRIEALRVAAGGVRIAMLVSRGGSTQLELGRIEWSGTAADPRLSVTGLRDVAPQLANVAAMSWAGQSRLVVVGQQEHGVQQLLYVDTDGSVAYTPDLPGISKVSAVAASENEDRPLLLESEEGMYRLPADGEWQLVSPDGSCPVYPG